MNAHSGRVEVVDNPGGGARIVRTALGGIGALARDHGPDTNKYRFAQCSE